MLMVNQLIGFGTSQGGDLITTPISGASGTVIGDASANSTAAYSGGDHALATATVFNTSPFTHGFSGKNYGSARNVSRCDMIGTTDEGFDQGGTGTITLLVYGKATAPANRTDGTLLATVSNFTDANTNTLKTATWAAAMWQYVWVNTQSTGNGGQCIGQIIFYEDI